MKKYLFYILILLIVISCTNKSKESSTNSALFFKDKLLDKKLFDSITSRVLKNGDKKAYHELRNIIFIGEQKKTNLLYYSIIMSNKYNNKDAAKDVYYILKNGGIIENDKKTNQLANDYLKKSEYKIE